MIICLFPIKTSRDTLYTAEISFLKSCGNSQTNGRYWHVTMNHRRSFLTYPITQLHNLRLNSISWATFRSLTTVFTISRLNRFVCIFLLKKSSRVIIKININIIILILLFLLFVVFILSCILSTHEVVKKNQSSAIRTCVVRIPYN